MGQAQPFHRSGLSKPTDHLAALRRFVDDLASGKTAIVADGIDATPTYALVLKAQIEHLERLLEE